MFIAASDFHKSEPRIILLLSYGEENVENVASHSMCLVFDFAFVWHLRGKAIDEFRIEAQRIGSEGCWWRGVCETTASKGNVTTLILHPRKLVW